MSTDTIETSRGPVPVLHRLALGLTTSDVVTDRATTGALSVGWEASGHLLPHGQPGWWPCVNFETLGSGRFRLRASAGRPNTLTVRIDDRTRRHVPRRLRVSLWPFAALVDPLPAHFVAVASRTLQLWLFPGAAYPLPSGSTAVRGRVTRQGRPVPWTRVSAVDAGGNTLGRAHGDDRGEFMLLVTDTFQNPLQSTVSVRLVVHGPVDTPAEPPVEPVTRPANPPNAGDLDNALLRGRTTPASHVPNTAPTSQLTIRVGEELILTDDVLFTP